MTTHALGNARRLRIVRKHPDTAAGTHLEYHFDEKMPPYLIVLRNVADTTQAIAALNDLNRKNDNRLANSPILVLRPGEEFEVYEIEASLRVTDGEHHG